MLGTDCDMTYVYTASNVIRVHLRDLQVREDIAYFIGQDDQRLLLRTLENNSIGRSQS